MQSFLYIFYPFFPNLPYLLVNYNPETTQKKAVVALPTSSQTHITENGK